MKTIFPIFLFLLFSIPSYGQHDIIDSLSKHLETASPGYDQVDYLIGLSAEYFYRGDKDNAYAKVNAANEIGKKLNDPQSKAHAMIQQSVLDIFYSNFNEDSEDFIKKALEVSQQSGDENLIALAHLNIATFLASTKFKPQEALDQIESYMEKEDPTILLSTWGQLYQQIAYCLKELKRFDEAKVFLDKSLHKYNDIKKQAPEHPSLNRVSAVELSEGYNGKIETYAQLSTVYLGKKNPTRAEEYLMKAYGMASSSVYLDSYAFICRKLGELQSLNGNYLQAIEYYQEAISILESLNLKTNAYFIKFLIMKLHFTLEDFEDVLRISEDVLPYYKGLNDTIATVAIGELEVRSLRYEDQLEESHQKAQAYVKMAEEMGNEYFRTLLLSCVAEVEIEKGQFNQAIEKSKTVLNFELKTKDQSRSIRTYGLLADLFFTKNEADSSILYATKGLAASQDQNSEKGIAAFNNKLYKAYKQAGDYKRALDYLALYSNRQDSMRYLETQKILQNEQVRQDVNKFKEETEEANTTAQLLKERNQLYIGLAIALGLILAFISYLFQQLRKTKKQLETQNQELEELNTTKDRFFSIIAHDIRSPIISLEKVGDLTAYYLKKNDTEKLSQLSEEVSGTAKRLNSLLDNLLNWALIQKGTLPNHPAKLNLTAMVEQALDMFRINAQMKNQTIENDLEEDLFVHADEKAVHTILRNLLSNAIKFTPNKGVIKVGAKKMEDQVLLQVKDFGIGMEQKKLEQIFKLDVRSDVGTQGERGTGLGLILCKELIELNAGKIKVNSQVNEGTEFMIILPTAA